MDARVQDFSGRGLREKDPVRAYRVRGTPTFPFVGPDGHEMMRFSGATRDAAEFMRPGRDVVEGQWRSGGFEQVAAP
ncbi:MAG: hypothetical protein HY778_16590 [Betaproteobacteria bacterium]|nr:hypothetical protein [Betaproteobacteria bacterium]